MNVNELIKEFLLKNKKYLVFYLLFMGAYPLTSVYLPKYYGQIIDNIKDNKDPNFKATFLTIILVNVMYLILDKIDAIFIPKLQSYIRLNVVKVVLENYKDNFEEQELGNLISMIVKFPIIVRDLVRQIRNYLIPIFIVFAMIVIRFMIIDKRVGTIALVGIVSSITFLTPLIQECLNKSSVMDYETDKVHEDISELFENMMDIYSMDTYDKEIKNLENSQIEIINRYKKTFNCTNKLRMYMNLFGTSLFLGIIVYSYQLYKKKQLNMASLINISVTGMYIINKIGSFSGEMPDIIFNIGTYIRIQKYLEDLHIKPRVRDDFTITNGKITFKNIDIKFDDNQILKNYNLTINPKESVAIIGKIGSGKSSLMKALLRLVPYKGDILLDNKNIMDIEAATVRKNIMYIRQNPLPFNRSLYENIVYGNDNATREQVENLFTKYDLHSFFENNLDKPVGKRGGKMSGGQKMVMFLLRVMIQNNNNKIIVLDEPTSSLDSTTANKVIDMIKDVTSTRTTVIITHDKNLENIVDRVINLSDNYN
jgi:ATP-binding cassette subfamily B protein